MSKHVYYFTDEYGNPLYVTDVTSRAITFSPDRDRAWELNVDDIAYEFLASGRFETPSSLVKTRRLVVKFYDVHTNSWYYADQYGGGESTSLPLHGNVATFDLEDRAGAAEVAAKVLSHSTFGQGNGQVSIVEIDVTRQS